ncbi:MAG: D-alanyl-D-alanine carboxypeptidase/D-alanyl-D-alanine-endopeptidase [Kineosporiaceae bacterium]
MVRRAVIAVAGITLFALLGPVTASGAGTSTPGPAVSVPGAVIPVRPAAVLPALDDAAPTPATGLGGRLDGVLAATALGPSVAAEVIDVASGTSLFGRAPTATAVPASTVKILTAAALLSVRSGDERLVTRVVQGAAGEIVLVGGGDVLVMPGRGNPSAVIGRAGLDDLAAATATALRAQRLTSVALGLDDTLFSGPTVSPLWQPGDTTGGFVAPVAALELDSGNAAPGRRAQAGHPFPRVSDPGLVAAQAFAVRLRAHGITVAAAPRRTDAPKDGAVLAQVESAPLARLVEQALEDSDNTVAEALARLVAISGNREPTFAGAGQAVLDRLALLGIDVSGHAVAGGSGMGRGYAVSPHTLVSVLALAASPDHPELRPVLSGLPLAGVTGTLADRFDTAAGRPAVGLVRAKTGTLTGVSSLAGIVVDADGRQLAFAVLADTVTATDPARAALDQVAATLARCGCS